MRLDPNDPCRDERTREADRGDEGERQSDERREIAGQRQGIAENPPDVPSDPLRIEDFAAVLPDERKDDDQPDERSKEHELNGGKPTSGQLHDRRHGDDEYPVRRNEDCAEPVRRPPLAGHAGTVRSGGHAG